MSTPILPFAPWLAGTNQNSIPANDNSLRNQILNGLVISDSTTAQPGSPANGDIYIIPAAATGTQWATFDEFDLTIFDSGTWYAFAPVEGVVVNLAGAQLQWDGAAYASFGGGGAVDSVNGQTGVVVLTAADVGAATSAQGALADTAVQPAGLATYAPLASPVLTGTPTAPTASPLTSTTQVATTEYVDDAVAAGGGAADMTTVTALSIASGVVNIDCALGDYFTLSMTANVTSVTFSNLPAAGKGASKAIRIRQDGTGSRTLALPSSFKASGNSDTAIQAAANAYTLLTLTTFDQGTRWEYAMQEIAA